MGNNQGKTWTALLIALLAAAFSVVVFLLKAALTPAQWVAYGLTMLAFVLLIVDVLAPFGGVKQYPMLNLPMSRITCIYFVAQLALGILAIFVMPNLSLKLVCLVGLAVVAAYVVASLLLTSGASHIVRQDEQDFRNVSALRIMTSQLEAAAGMAGDPSLRQDICALAEQVRYSDPVSGPSVSELEERIRSNIALLREDLEDSDLSRARNRVEKLKNMVSERNQLIRATKR